LALFEELKRRNVFRVGVAYVVGAWVVLQIVDFVLDAIAAPNWIVQACILVAIVGLPVVLVVAWVFELTPEGIKRDSEVDRTESIATGTGRKMDRVIIGFLVLAILILVGERFLGSDSTIAPMSEEMGSTIAVLPFVNMSSSQEQEYFSDGITEEILNRLASIRGLQVAARTSVFSFKNQNQDIREIAEMLGVQTILEGSVRRSEDEVRITAQLIRASDGFHLWSETYDRKLENVFAVQDDIASRIAEALQVSMGVAGQSGTVIRTVDPEVYDLYLRARAIHRQRGEGLLEAIELFEKALAIDPEFAPAWAGLSHTYNVIPNYISVQQYEDLGDIMGKSLAAAQQALDLDPNLPSAIHAMANNLLFSFEWAQAQQHYLKALELDPDSADIMEDYVSLLTFAGQPDIARPFAERMIELDPYVPVFHNAMIMLLMVEGETELKEKHIQIALEINPDLPNIQLTQLGNLLVQGRFDEARNFVTAMGEIRVSKNTTFKVLDWLASGARGTPEPEVMAVLDEIPTYIYLAGRYDLWIEAVESAADGWPEWYISPVLDLYAPIGSVENRHRFRSEPRTKEYLESLRLPEFWRQEGWPDMCQPVGEEDFECA